MADVYAMSGNTPNFSGVLFNKGNTLTPFSTLIGASRMITNHVEFATAIEYATGGGAQPSISEEASLIAPDAAVIVRDQKSNVTQIHQKTVGVSYGKMSNMGTMSGINVANQVANPAEELSFQIAAKMAEIAQDIEYSFLNGVYNKAANDTQVNQTRGLLPAITTNVVDASGKPLTFMMVCAALDKIRKANASTANIILGVDAVNQMQLNADAVANGLTIVDSGRTLNGINVLTVLTPLGSIDIAPLIYLPAGTAVLFDASLIRPVEQPTPDKGNFFLEELAKVGAGARYQIFGQIGLDHGPEWCSAKIEDLSVDMPTDADFAKRVSVNP